MDVNLVTSLIGWVGVACVVTCNFPQLRDALKYGRKVRVSRATYTLLLWGVGCFLIRAIAIMEPVFIVSNGVSLVCIFFIRRKLK